MRLPKQSNSIYRVQKKKQFCETSHINDTKLLKKKHFLMLISHTEHLLFHYKMQI